MTSSEMSNRAVDLLTISNQYSSKSNNQKNPADNYMLNALKELTGFVLVLAHQQFNTVQLMDLEYKRNIDFHKSRADKCEQENILMQTENISMQQKIEDLERELSAANKLKNFTKSNQPTKKLK